MGIISLEKNLENLIFAKLQICHFWIIILVKITVTALLDGKISQNAMTHYECSTNLSVE